RRLGQGGLFPHGAVPPQDQGVAVVLVESDRPAVPGGDAGGEAGAAGCGSGGAGLSPRCPVPAQNQRRAAREAAVREWVARYWMYSLSQSFIVWWNWRWPGVVRQGWMRGR